MALRLSLSGAGRGSRVLTSGTLSIGRSERNDWQLDDPDRHLSKTHCVISAEMGQYVLTDLSTNGVYINGARQPTSRDSRVILTDGDQFRLGEYLIAVEEVAGPGASAPSSPGGSALDGDPLDIDPLDDPLGRTPDPSFSHPVHAAAVPRRMEDPFDRMDENRPRPMASPDDDLFSGVKPAVNWSGPSQPDHADAPRHAMALPKVLPPVSAPNNAMDIDFDALIGDLSPFAAPAPPPQGSPPTTRPQPVTNDPFAEFDDLMAPAPSVPQPLPNQAPVPQAPPTPPTTAPAQPAAATAPQAATSPAAALAGDGMQAALRVVLEAAGLAGNPLINPATADAEATLRNIGEVFRALTEGLREVLMSRAAIKGELRVEQTLMKSHNNNPLKFSFSPDDAVVALLSAGRPGYMPPLKAAREAFDDIKTHELAVIAGVQTALIGLLHRFDPETLESRLTSTMLASVLPGARKARLWDSFRDLYKTIASEAEDDFQAVFGKAFAKAYKAQSNRE